MLELFLKYIWIIPVLLSIKAALTMDDKTNVKRTIDIMVIGSITFFVATFFGQDSLKVIGVLIFFYGLGLVTYYKFREGLKDH
ncbi:MAG: hypothetical protein AB1420_07990 [Bacillota bacterium]